VNSQEDEDAIAQAAVEEEQQQMDLYEILTKPVADMSDDELLAAVGTIREQRKIKISSSKQKSALDLLLGRISPENARILLAQMKAKEDKDVGIGTGIEGTEKIEEQTNPRVDSGSRSDAGTIGNEAKG
jgi:hypothetical protein